jgi:D-alanyl-D-alanine carboxypeptidase
MSCRTRSTILPALVVVSAALIGVLGCQSLAGSSSSPTSPIAAEPRALRPAESRPGDPPRALGEADGIVPDGVTVFDDGYPAVANLDPAFHRALRRAANDAARDRVTFSVDSGWRSPKYQEQLLDAAIARYGSEKEAARWVATPSTSAHVSGAAVDIGPAAATAWLSKHGATYGLCQIYRNEPWHYELRTNAIAHGCPAMYADPTQDPRMRQ